MFKKIFLGLLLGLIFSSRVLAQGADYYLPYPGILPDHPLYWLKMVRDRVGLWTTVGETAKAEKLLLYADKRLGAAWALIEGNKVPLGVSTLTKGEKYLEQAASSSDASFKQKLAKAVLKHEEVIIRLQPGVGADYAPLLEEMQRKLQRLSAQMGVMPAAQAVDISVAFSSQKVTEAQVEATTAFDALEKLALANSWELQVKDYDFGKLVESINGVTSDKAMAWIVYVNGEAVDKASDKFELNSGDKVEWRYEKVKP